MVASLAEVWVHVCASVCVGGRIKSRVNVQFLLPQIELNRFLNVLPGPQSHSISATLTCTLCLCRRHNGNNNNNNNDISCHICLRLSHPWMIRHVCMCLPWRSPFPLSLSPTVSFPWKGKWDNFADLSLPVNWFWMENPHKQKSARPAGRW